MTQCLHLHPTEGLAETFQLSLIEHRTSDSSWLHSWPALRCRFRNSDVGFLLHEFRHSVFDFEGGIRGPLQQPDHQLFFRFAVRMLLLDR